MAVIDVRLLGPVAVGADDAVPLGGAKQRGLFTLLAASVPPRRTDEQIIDDLWGQEPPASARNAVQVYVSGLRRALQPLGLEVARSGDGYALTGAPVRVDSVIFETVVAQGRAALRAGDAERAADLLVSALGMWTGKPFDGVGDLPALERWRGALEGLRQSALADLASAQLRAGRPEEAIITAQSLVSDHPYDERGWVARATAEYWSGRQADALSTCAQARALLADELGVDPGPELAGLSELILRHEMVELAPQAPQEEGGDPSLPSLPPEPDPFVGRQHELESVLHLVQSGTRVVTLMGMGGIGKTTLALAAAHRLSATDRTVLFCELETDVDAASALDRICRELDVDPGEDPAAAIAGGPASVIVLDNAEQVAGLGEALSALVRRHRSPQFLVTSRMPVGVRGEQNVSVLPLTVSPEEGSEPAAAELFWFAASRVRPELAARRADDHRAVLQLCELLGGIPLAIELVASRTRTQTPTQLLRRVEEQRTSVLDTSSTSTLPRHATLRVVIEAAVSAVSAPARQLLILASAVDGWLCQETLERVAEETVADFLTALDDLAAHGLVVIDSSGRVRLLSPVRELVRESEESGQALHRLLPVLLRRAEELGPRLYGVDAAEAMAELSQDADAISTVLQRAVEVEADAETVTVAARLLIALRRYWLLASRIPQAQRTCARLAESLLLSDLERARVAVLEGNFAQWLVAPGALDQLDAALAEATRLGAPNDRLLVSGWCAMAAQAATYQDAEGAMRAMTRAADAAADSGDPALVALVEDLEGYVAMQTGDLETALQACLRGLEAARTSNGTYDVITMLVNTAETLSELRRDDEAVALADEAFELSPGVQLGAQGTVALMIRAAVQAAAGQLAAARGSALEGLRSARLLHPVPKIIADGLRSMAAIEAGHGRDEEAARCHGAALALRADVGLTGELQGSRIEELAAAARERLGGQAWEVHSAVGAADPMGVVDRLLDSAV